MQVKQPKLALMCNELLTVRAITDASARMFDVALAGDVQTLKSILDGEPSMVAVVIDIAALQVDAIKVLESVKKDYPGARRILLTDFCDLRIIIEGLHTGAIQRIVYKPIYAPELLGAIGINSPQHAYMNPAQQQHTRVAV
jgi:DNA-binding NtrC family response regulator